jgi:hypothetical protein
MAAWILRQQPKRSGHYVKARLGWAQICDLWLCMSRADGCWKRASVWNVWLLDNLRKMGAHNGPACGLSAWGNRMLSLPMSIFILHLLSVDKKLLNKIKKNTAAPASKFAIYDHAKSRQVWIQVLQSIMQHIHGERIGIAWLKAGIWRLRRLRRVSEKTRCPVYLGKQNAKHTLLKYLERKRWRK